MLDHPLNISFYKSYLAKENHILPIVVVGHQDKPWEVLLNLVRPFFLTEPVSNPQLMIHIEQMSWNAHKTEKSKPAEMLFLLQESRQDHWPGLV